MVQGEKVYAKKKTYYSIEYFSMPSLSLQNTNITFYSNINPIIALLLLCDKKISIYKDVWFKGCNFWTISRINLSSDVKTKVKCLRPGEKIRKFESQNVVHCLVSMCFSMY